MPEFFKVRVGNIAPLISVLDDTVRVISKEAEDELKATYPKMYGHDLEQDTVNFTFEEFIRFAKRHVILNKINWETAFGLPKRH